MDRPAIVCVGSIIIDDIVLPDGVTRMGVLGGGVTHAAAGVAVWGERPGIVACVGRDLPEPVRERLARDFDLQGVIALDAPQARAWQIFEWDGRRTEIFRVDVLEPFLVDPQPEQVPAAYGAARGLQAAERFRYQKLGMLDTVLGMSCVTPDFPRQAGA